MFDNARYITSGINEEVDESIQVLLWNFIDLLKLKEDFTIDWLQVFELREISNSKTFNQEIVHSQEEPLYKKHYLVAVDKPISTKIYVIDDSEQSVLMLSKEY
ncbi:DUF960 domain-containing protein [Clostridium bowmanii]|uniref:DUF960 family protein n=1 Tax=Clostridium bowmanii TaxID=132925 RepID=UPI001C0B17DF|nr:DUF960 family protein [Clostridium bowmanii]MBU3190162.1 DUF960 domain-containing protein [Clostridium bowmanii]MCA1074758.1 DUF960 domain-containing protein [Clostridium bowmanii]